MTSTELTSADAPPVLSISVVGADPVEYAAVPTLGFQARVETADARGVQSIVLHAQIRIAAATRPYSADEQRRLVELFGAPAEWGRSLRSLLWTHAAVRVPAFGSSASVHIPVACTYDFEVVAAKYLDALSDGEIPLEFLFSGTVFYLDEDRLRAAQIPWQTEAQYRLPVAVWRETMDHYFPHSAWLRLGQDTFDRLYAYKSGHTLATWDDAVHAVLDAAERGDHG
jgi:hypothetical protein